MVDISNMGTPFVANVCERGGERDQRDREGSCVLAGFGKRYRVEERWVIHVPIEGYGKGAGDVCDLVSLGYAQ